MKTVEDLRLTLGSIPDIEHFHVTVNEDFRVVIYLRLLFDTEEVKQEIFNKIFNIVPANINFKIYEIKEEW